MGEEQGEGNDEEGKEISRKTTPLYSVSGRIPSVPDLRVISDQSVASLTNLKENKDFTGSVKFILFFNMIVAYSFYSFNATLATFFTSNMHYGSDVAGFITNTFIFSNYLFSVIGGFVADEYLGKFMLMIFAGVIFVLGTVLCVLVEAVAYVDTGAENFIFPALLVVAAGNGAIIPCISSFMGDQFLEGQELKRSSYFYWLYLSTQMGSIVSSFLAPIILDYWPALNFVIAAAVTCLGYAGLVVGWRKYNKLPPVRNVYSNFFAIIWEGIRKKKAPGTHWLDVAKERFDSENVEDVKTALQVLLVFVPIPFFWAIYFQIFSLWVFMAKSMNLNLWGWSVPPGSITVLNPLMDLFLIPFFAKLFFPFMAMLKLPFSPLKRMGLGLIFTILSLVTAGLIQLEIDRYPPNTISILWVIPQFFLISMAEISLSIPALEFAYTQSPVTMKAMITAMWYMTLATGNLIVALVALIDTSRVALEYFIMAIVIFGILGIHIAISIGYTYMEHGRKVTQGGAKLPRANKDVTLQLEHDSEEGWSTKKSDPRSPKKKSNPDSPRSSPTSMMVNGVQIDSENVYENDPLLAEQVTN